MPHRSLVVAALLLLCALVLGACGSTTERPMLGTLYNRSAQHHGPERNPVILIPGILGSRLKDPGSGRVVWGSFRGRFADPSSGKGARLFGLPMAQGRSLRELRDQVVPDGVLDHLDASFLGLTFQVDAYRQILGTLGAGGYLDEDAARKEILDYGDDHFTCFQFDYDWRRDIVESAQKLHAFILQKRAYVQAELERRFGVHKEDVKFDIVAHSMGCLVARYFMRYGDADLKPGPPQPTWAGSGLVDRVMLVAPPNAGSLDAVLKLNEGEDFSIITPEYDAAILGTFPSLYELLPRTRHAQVRLGSAPDAPVLDLFRAENWLQHGWGMLQPEQDAILKKLLNNAKGRKARRALAEDHIRKCLARAQSFQAALDVPAQPPPNVALILFAGDAAPTPSQATVDVRTGRISITRRAAGDGTVLRSSALLDERLSGTWQPELASPIPWKQVIFLFTDHLGLTSDPHCTDNLLFQLLEAPRPPRRPFASS